MHLNICFDHERKEKKRKKNHRSEGDFLCFKETEATLRWEALDRMLHQRVIQFERGHRTPTKQPDVNLSGPFCLVHLPWRGRLHHSSAQNFLSVLSVLENGHYFLGWGGEVSHIYPLFSLWIGC